MNSHLFYQLGMWSERLEAINIKAIKIDNYGILAFLFITEIFFFSL